MDLIIVLSAWCKEAATWRCTIIRSRVFKWETRCRRLSLGIARWKRTGCANYPKSNTEYFKKLIREKISLQILLLSYRFFATLINTSESGVELSKLAQVSNKLILVADVANIPRGCLIRLCNREIEKQAMVLKNGGVISHCLVRSLL